VVVPEAGVMNADPEAPVRAVIKLGARAHMEALITKGLLYMNPVSYFVGLEGEPRRADPDEATRYCHPAEGATFQVQRGNDWQTLGTITGPIKFRDDQLANANLYCMHARRSYGLLNLDDFSFGDTYVVLLDPREFLRRLAIAAEKAGRELQHGLVEYVPRTHTGDMGLFRKFDDYAAQSEFRIVLPAGDGLPFSLYLGDLRDIAMIGATAERLKLAPKTI
jgi:hypothetical protein